MSLYVKKPDSGVIILEAGYAIEGIWRWNCDPEASVDSEIPEYMYYAIPET